LSFENLIIRSVEGERRFGRNELPLRVGTGGDCQLRLPGPGGEPVALLDLLDDLPIVQPVGRNTLLRINDVPLEASRRLVDGVHRTSQLRQRRFGVQQKPTPGRRGKRAVP